MIMMKWNVNIDALLCFDQRQRQREQPDVKVSAGATQMPVSTLPPNKLNIYTFQYNFWIIEWDYSHIKCGSSALGPIDTN